MFKIIKNDDFVGVKNVILNMVELLKNPNMDFKIKAIILAALTYLISHLDMLPDAIPFFGYLDDIALIMMAANHISDMVGDNVDFYQIKKKSKMKMTTIIYSLVTDDKKLDYNYTETKGNRLWRVNLSELKKYNLKINDHCLPMVSGHN